MRRRLRRRACAPDQQVWLAAGFEGCPLATQDFDVSDGLLGLSVPGTMTNNESIDVPSDQCEGCGQVTPNYDIVHYGSSDSGYRDLCSRCVNADIARRCGVEDFEHVSLVPLAMADGSGTMHEFHFQTRLFGEIVSIEAFELESGHRAGYQFQIVGGPEDERFALVARLIERMRRSLAVSYLTDDGEGLQIVDRTVCGRIVCDLDQPLRIPQVVIDGREISWEDFGRMLMTFEGWQFKLQIFERSEEP
jgi:hypothetical protein